MAYIITGTLTFSSKKDRDAALLRINAALLLHTFITLATEFPSGVNAFSNDVITISLNAGENSVAAAALAKGIYDAAIQTNRQTAGYLSVNKI